jgi:hypothetical protein
MIVVFLVISGIILYLVLFSAVCDVAFNLTLWDFPWKIRIPLMVTAFLMFTIPLTLFFDAINNEPVHGSCKYEHYAGKGYVCDEYYPLPQVENP